jgi:hypothetical protein
LEKKWTTSIQWSIFSFLKTKTSYQYYFSLGLGLIDYQSPISINLHENANLQETNKQEREEW